MPQDRPPATLLRLAAFLLDVLLFALILILPATVVSWTLVFTRPGSRPISLVWWTSVALLMAAILFRDGWRGRSPGKRLFGLQIATPSGRPCGWSRSAVRNLPLFIPLWNLIELWMVCSPRSLRRTGDRLARTTVVEE